MIRTWIADVTPLYNREIYEKYYNIVPDFRQEKADRMRKAENKAQSIGAWVLYEKAREMCGIHEDAVYNLSHSGKFCLCSIGDGKDSSEMVGCDIEEIKKLPTKLIERRFLASEREYILRGETEEQKKEAFYRYWVLKESFMKATRRGMALGLDTFEIYCGEEGAPKLTLIPEGIKERYFFKEYHLDIPYKIAVCSTVNTFAKEIQRIEL